MGRGPLTRFAVVALCLTVPAGFYVYGDITDAFPGVLTLHQDEGGPETGPPAQGEDYARADAAPLLPASATAVDPGVGADLQQRMDAHADLEVVDGNLSYAVIDAASGEVLAERDADTARTPASTVKLLVGAAALRTMDAETTLPTTAVLEGSTLTLVGGGDMRLTPEDVDTLARLTADLAEEQGVDGPVTLRLDDTLFGEPRNPAWGDNGPDGGWVAPITAIAVNEGRLDANQYGRKSTDPSMDAAELFAERLAEHGLEVDEDIARATAPEGAPSVQIQSEPLSELVAHTMLISDNTTSEVLGRLVARARGEEPTPAGAALAVEEEMLELAAERDLPTGGFDLHDTCGLAVDNRVPPALLAGVVADISTGSSPELEQLLTDVPISGLSGTLADRFDEDEATEARGLVRAKTGYLGGTATLAGVAALPDGRVVGYSIAVHGFDRADGVPAREAVDVIAAEIVRAPA
ncbi:MAG: D-alanyl-D-alanine carboxypeptidase [Brachybacterium sp.]|nr:D-alanyl-D-alanine carboxypeptidase [Brachybacterium sp.]